MATSAESAGLVQEQQAPKQQNGKGLGFACSTNDGSQE